MIIQAGIYPPPIGGVSMYMKRFKDYMDANNIRNELWDVSSNIKNVKGVKNVSIKKLPFEYFKMSSHDLIHYNVSGIFAKNYFAFFNRLLFKKRKKVMTIHGSAEGIFDDDKKKMVRSLNSYDGVICVKENDSEYLRSAGVGTRIYEIPAFIPPIFNKQEADEIPQEVWNFINEHDYIISANGFRLNFHNNEDLYGADLCVELCSRLKKSYPNIGFIFSLSGIGNMDYYNELIRRIKEYGIEKNVVFYGFISDKRKLELMRKAHVLLHASVKEGWGLVVLEAASQGTPAVVYNVSGLRDVVKNNKTGIILNENNPEDMAQEAIKLFYDKKLYKNFQENGLAWAKSITWQDATKKSLQLLSNI